MARRLLALLALASGTAAARPAPAQQAPTYDVLIRHGRVLDGTGNPWRYADVAITGDRIVAVGDLPNARAKRVVDATGLYVTPGFIDTHSHAGPALATPALSGAVPLLAEGITTVMANPDGGGPVNLVQQRAKLEAQHPAINVGLMVPHGSVRGAVLGSADVKADSAAIVKMRALVKAGMEAGAFGMSSGPFYAPGSYSNTEELVELSKVAAQYGGLYTSHIRDESDYTVGLSAAVDEVIRVAREAQLPGIVTHVKALGPHVWGMSSQLVARIDSVRNQGVQVYTDQYPYEASGTSLVSVLVPRWAESGGRDSMKIRFADASLHARLWKEMTDNLERRGGAARLQFSGYGPDHSIEGTNLQQYADAQKLGAIDAAVQLMKKADAGIVSFNMDDKDIATFMRQPWNMTCSDGDLVRMGDGVPHPRAYGTFPRKIRKYVLEDRVIDLAAAIRSMTSLSASVFKIQDRGVLRPGAFADVNVMDLAKVRDKATYTNPHQLSEGMVYVFVNGTVAVDGGKPTNARGGRVLSRKDYRADR